MRYRFLLIVAIASLISAPLLGQAGKQTSSKPWAQGKTSWGDPDLQGTWTSDDYIGVPLQRNVDVGTRLQRNEQEISAAQANIQRTTERNAQEFQAANAAITVNPPGHWGEGARRPALQTSMITVPEDGRMPALTPEAQQRVAANAEARRVTALEGPSWTEYSFYIRCISRGLMGSTLPVIYGNGSQILQGPGYVAIMYEMVHEARIIPLDGSPHPGPNVRSYMGAAPAHSEANTLVVETTNFLPNKTGIGLNGGGTPTSDALKVTERFTRTGVNTMNYQAMIDDPKTYTAPFTISYPITQEPGYQNFEYACHEGNYAMRNSLTGSSSPAQ